MSNFRRSHYQGIVLLVLLILFASLMTLKNFKAQTPSIITVNADGSVSGSNLIQKNGTYYTLKANLNNVSIVVECNNIQLNGGGFTLQGAAAWDTPAAINLTCTNTTIENFNIPRWEVGILGAYDNNTIKNNIITNCERGIAIYADNYCVRDNGIGQNSYGIRILNSKNNVIVGNTLQHNRYAIDTENSTLDVIVANVMQDNSNGISVSGGGYFEVYHNNFIDQNRAFNGGYFSIILNAGNGAGFKWDNGYQSGGNYYDDYASRYPNATEIGTSGIGNVPYLISENPNPSTNNPTVADRYPLISPVNISEAEQLPLSPLPIISPTTSSTANPSSNGVYVSPTATQSPIPSQTPSPTPTKTSLGEATTQTPVATKTDTPKQSLSDNQLWFAVAAFALIMAIVTVSALLKRNSKRQDRVNYVS